MIGRLGQILQRTAVDLLRVGRTLELLAMPASTFQILSGRLVAPCPHCRQQFLIGPPEQFDLIAAALAVRPDPTTRNWSPGEAVADLQRENAAHGIGEQDGEPPAVVTEAA